MIEIRDSKLTIKEAAVLLGCTPTEVEVLIDQRQLKYRPVRKEDIRVTLLRQKAARRFDRNVRSISRQSVMGLKATSLVSNSV